jgi:hypothetical protein
MDNSDCNTYALPSPLEPENLENAYFHPDTLLFWSKCSNSRNTRNNRKSDRFEPYTKSNQRLLRKHSASSEPFSNDFMLPPSYFSTCDHKMAPVTRTLTGEVEETMERLHF